MFIKKKLLVWSLLLLCMSVQKTYSMDNKYKLIGCGLSAGVCFALSGLGYFQSWIICKPDWKFNKHLCPNSKKCSDQAIRNSLIFGAMGTSLAFAGFYFYSKAKSGL